MQRCKRIDKGEIFGVLWVQVALQQADYVAWNIWAALANRPLLPFRYQHLGTMVTLGNADGAVALNVPLPTGAAPGVLCTAGHCLNKAQVCQRWPGLVVGKTSTHTACCCTYCFTAPQMPLPLTRPPACSSCLSTNLLLFSLFHNNTLTLSET